MADSKLRFHRKRRPKELLDLDFVLTVDRSMMSNHHRKEFLGFLTTSPAVILPEKLWVWIACPRMKVDRYGRPFEAPYGMRKVEAALQEAGFKAAIIDPDYIWPYLRKAKALMIGHHDYFGLCPPSTEWWWLTGKEPINRRSFIELISQPEIWQAHERGMKIVVGGPAAWQWLVEPGALEKWPVDVIVEGEGEEIMVKIAEKILAGEELPRHIVVPPHEAPKLDKIPAIKAASVNGLIEIMRGCPRGCKFCPVTLRPLRYIPVEFVLKEIKVNLDAGLRNIILHSEDVLVYGAYGIIPNPDKVLKLHQEVVNLAKKYGNVAIAWSHATLSTVKVAEEKFKLVSKISELLTSETATKFLAFQTGIETGSPRLAKQVMPAKSAPYPAEKWPEVVEDAFRILADVGAIPAATVILGLPGETPDDLVATAELIEKLKPYPSLIVPMFFVPMGRLKNHDWFRKEDLLDEHIDVLWLCFKHTAYWAPRIMAKYIENPIVTFFLRLFVFVAERIVKRLEKKYKLPEVHKRVKEKFSEVQKRLVAVQTG